MTRPPNPSEQSDPAKCEAQTFDGQIHMNHIREALWDDSTNGAVVLLGAGFSRNALVRPPAEGRLPLWSDIARSLKRKLTSRARCGEASEAVPAEAIPRLAQDYEAAFGRPELHRHLRDAIRDDEFLPGPVHERLMALPWRDVLTTNWDTLLERTNDNLSSRHYRVISCVEDIPLARSPRIVKLHGSLPCQFPLILTEEDYRRYPIDFAAFVNMVQQAMLESVLCLIGFSGDDPNFLAWHGWVRDNLGSHAWKLYLIGWHNLTPQRRQMLEARNVIPIDLARHPKAHLWPEQDRHRLANEWVLSTLEHGRPYDLSDWPEPRQDSPDIEPVLQPVSTSVSATPTREPSPSPGKSGNQVATREELAKVTRVWAHNRVLYPGWLAVPNSRRYSLLHSTDEWEGPMLGAVSTSIFTERLRVAYEIVWRRSILLDPPSDPLRKACQKLVDEAEAPDLFRHGIHDADPQNPTSWVQWRTLVRFLLPDARLRFDQSEFDRLLSLLEPFQSKDPQVSHIWHHERALWAAYSLDHATLGSVLDDWSVGGADLVWSMRKASLLLEIHDQDAAEAMLGEALKKLAERTDRDQHIASSSREAWLLCTLYGSAYRQGRHRASDMWRRWRELGRIRCDADQERSSCLDALRPDKEEPERTPFDLDRVEVAGFSWSSRPYERWRAAHRAIRLCDVAALPPRAWGFAIGSPLMEAAIDVLDRTDIELSARLCLRIANYDKDAAITRVFARHRVATMQDSVISNLRDMCVRSLDYYTGSSRDGGKQSVFEAEKVRVAIEVLSRLVVRLDDREASEVLERSLRLYREPTVAANRLLHEPMRHLLARSWEAVSDGHRRDAVFSLLHAPILGLDGFVGGDGHPDACVGAHSDWTPPERDGDNEHEWRTAVDLILRGLGADGIAREHAANRGYLLNVWKRFKPHEAAPMADALWRRKDQEAGALPEGTGLRDWVFLFLPEPESGVAQARFWTKWARRDVSGRESTVDALEEVNGLISQSQDVPGDVDLPAPGKERLIAHVEAWAKDAQQSTFPFDQSDVQWLQTRAVRALCNLLVEIQVPNGTADLLYERVIAMNQADVSGLPLIAGILNAKPAYADDGSAMIKTCLAADSPQHSEGAIWGVYQWARAALVLPQRIPELPEELIREIGNVVAIRRRKVLRPALDIATWVVEKAPPVHADLVVPLAIQGLGFLVEELRYENEGEDRKDVPALRRNCVRLAFALADRGWGEGSAVRAWISESETDPLPEARFARPKAEK